MGVSVCGSCADPWSDSQYEPLWACLFAIYPCCLVDSMAFTARCSGIPSLEWKNLKSWGIRCWAQPFTAHGEAGCCECPPYCMLVCWGWGLCWDCVSSSPTYFDAGFSSFARLCRSPSASWWISFRVNCLVYSCRNMVSMGGGKLGLVCCHHVLEYLFLWHQILLKYILLQGVR